MAKYVLMSSSSESFSSWTARSIATPTKGLAMEPMFMTVSGVNGRVRGPSAKPYPLVHTTCRSTIKAAPSSRVLRRQVLGEEDERGGRGRGADEVA